MKRVGLLTLNKNIDNFFNENEQLAFSVAHVVPGEHARASAHPPCEKGHAHLAMHRQHARIHGVLRCAKSAFPLYSIALYPDSPGVIGCSPISTSQQKGHCLIQVMRSWCLNGHCLKQTA